ncbi:hypothetical protein [Tellurirhabdus rosea]|uniref:hypothetical protein n=1 Tax=Tellurirhabdus rosea TaxID=2674997 RepID=UPI00225A717A|nr:hypothetical protein [Tellurirhabdus rosea]
MKFRNFALLIVWGTALLACQSSVEKREADPAGPDLSGLGYDFAPLELGRFWVYEVTEQRIPLGGSPIERIYQIRETLTETYTDLSNARAYRIERAIRLSDNQPWEPDSAGSIRLTQDQLIRTENNRDFVRLVFPVYERAEWDGNLFNSLGADAYQIRNTRCSYSVLNQTFPETITVVQQNDSTRVNQDRRLEVYARQVGLVYRERVQVQFCSSTPGCVGKGQVDFGIRQYIRLKSYGRL